MPSEAERTVGGKVIGLPRLMCVMMKCRNRLGRALTQGDLAGLAVAHFDYRRHKRVLFAGTGISRLSFWGSTPEIADGLQNLFTCYLKDFLLGPFMQKDSWAAARRALEDELGMSAPFPLEEYRQFVQATDIAASIAPDSPAARAAGLVAVKAPGVRAAENRSPRAQRLFAFRLGFSPIADIRQLVLVSIVKEPRDSFWGEAVRPFNHGSKEGQVWLVQWKQFLSHRERALIVGPKRIHETLKYDVATEKLLFMLAAYDSMRISGAATPPIPQRVFSVHGFPPRCLVNAETLAKWNADFAHIWAHFDRLVGPRLAFPPGAPDERVPPPVLKPDDAMREARKATAANRPLSNHKAHQKRHRALPKKSATWVAMAGPCKLLVRSKSSPV
ncbi:hypothetical protein AURDEDRAFT_161284 [Auricularia subglabra TFB-10046 SS5]|nr:hypothetical protein AURDEDRAFT_161284 [Auricularia subglabra TFB-10046 SS5]